MYQNIAVWVEDVHTIVGMEQVPTGGPILGSRAFVKAFYLLSLHSPLLPFLLLHPADHGEVERVGAF